MLVSNDDLHHTRQMPGAGVDCMIFSARYVRKALIEAGCEIPSAIDRCL
jgi:hypothetical protein